MLKIYQIKWSYLKLEFHNLSCRNEQFTKLVKETLISINNLDGYIWYLVCEDNEDMMVYSSH